MVDITQLSPEQRAAADSLLAEPDVIVSHGEVIRTAHGYTYVLTGQHVYPVHDDHELITDDGSANLLTYPVDFMPPRHLERRGPGRWDVLPMLSYPVPRQNVTPQTNVGPTMSTLRPQAHWHDPSDKLDYLGDIEANVADIATSPRAFGSPRAGTCPS